MHRRLTSLRCFLPFLLAGGLALSFAGCVTTGNFRQFEEQVRSANEATRETLGELREDSRKTQKNQAELKADMIDLRTEFQQLTGDVSSGQHSRSSEAREREAMETSLAMQLSHIQSQLQLQEARMARMEKYLGLKPLPPPSPPTGTRGSGAPGPEARPEVPAPGELTPEATFSPPVPAQPPVTSNPEEAYEVAYRLFKSKKVEGARSAFEQFLRDYPRSSLAGNALFWIGETFYNDGKFEYAIVKYQEVMEKFPKGAKAPDALLKMGLSLEKMGETEAAVAAFKKLQQDYPGSSQVDLARKKVLELKPKPKAPGKDKGH